MNSAVFDLIKKGTSASAVAHHDNKRKKSVISYFTTQGESTIPELSQFLSISIPKTSTLITDLLFAGLVIDTGRKSVGTGRKAKIYSLNPCSCYFLGVEIRKYKINIGLLDFNGGVVESELNIPFRFANSEESFNAIIKEIQQFLGKISISKDKIVAIGLSLAGRINVKTGEILSIYHFGNAPVKAKLEESLGVPVFLDNDSRTISYGEYHFGAEGLPYTEKNVCIVNLDYGIAMSAFCNGVPIYGASGYAGEIGHIPLFNNEIICYCGKKGCFETEASGFALIEYLMTKMKNGSASRLQKTVTDKGFLELEDIIEAVRYGDNLALEGVAEIGNKIGKGLAVLINLYNPELIVLGGMLSAIGRPLLLEVKSSVIKYTLSIVNEDTKIILSDIGQKAGLLGCCLLTRDKICGLI